MRCVVRLEPLQEWQEPALGRSGASYQGWARSEGGGSRVSFRNESITKLRSKAKFKPMTLESCLQADILKSIPRVIHFIF